MLDEALVVELSVSLDGNAGMHSAIPTLKNESCTSEL